MFMVATKTTANLPRHLLPFLAALLLLRATSEALIISDNFHCSKGHFAHFGRRAGDLNIVAECSLCPAGKFMAQASEWGGCKHCAAGKWSMPGTGSCAGPGEAGWRSSWRGAASAGVAKAAKAAALAPRAAAGQQKQPHLTIVQRQVAQHQLAARRTPPPPPRSLPREDLSAPHRHSLRLRDRATGVMHPSVVVPKTWRCEPGYYTSLGLVRGSFRATCAMCPVGKYQPHATARRVSCRPCSAGRWSAHGGAARCVGDKFGTMAFCQPGRWAAKTGSGDGKGECAHCPAGRYGLGSSRSAACDGLCRPGRFGSGGSTTAMCDGPCEEQRFCRAGAKAKDDGGLCPRGKYQFEEVGIGGCLLTSPPEYRPAGGFSTAAGEQGACVLDKAMRLVEVLYALKTCDRFAADGADGGVCDAGLARALARDTAECCAPDGVSAERALVTPRQRRQCTQQVKSITAALDRDLTALRGLSNVEKASDANLWDADADEAEGVVLPLFRATLRAAKVLYAAAPADDMTFVSAELVNMCRPPKRRKGEHRRSRCDVSKGSGGGSSGGSGGVDGGTGESGVLRGMVQYLEEFDCAVTDCDAAQLKRFFMGDAATDAADRADTGGGAPPKAAAPVAVPSPAPLPLVGEPCAAKALRLVAECGGCETAAGVDGCFGLFKDTGVRHLGRPVYTQTEQSGAGFHALGCGALRHGARVSLYYGGFAGGGRWVLGGRVGEPPYVLTALSVGRAPNQVPPGGWHTGGVVVPSKGGVAAAAAAGGGWDAGGMGPVAVRTLVSCMTPVPTSAPTFAPTPTLPTPAPLTPAPAASGTEKAAGARLHGLEALVRQRARGAVAVAHEKKALDHDACAKALEHARSARCAALVNVPAAFLSLADEDSEGVRDCERCLLEALRKGGCATFAAALVARSENKDLVTWDSPLKMCLRPS